MYGHVIESCSSQNFDYSSTERNVLFRYQILSVVNLLGIISEIHTVVMFIIVHL
jgi:hypothetical protein